jgi:hypothetical protein
MKKKVLFMGGAHRGGQAITAEVLKTGPAYDQVMIADPKEYRAKRLADDWKNHGIHATGYKEPCEEILDKIDAGRVVLAIDTIAPMAKVLRKAELPTQWQLLAKGIGANGPVIGLAGTLVNGDRDSRASSVRLIDVLSSFIEPQSSGRIRANPLNADGLHVMRKKMSEHTSRRLGVLEKEPEDIKGGPLNILWNQTDYPLVVQEKPSGERWKEVKEQALDTALPRRLADSREFAVASIGNKNVDFFVVESGRRRSVRFHMPLVKMLTVTAGTGSNGNGFPRILMGGLGLAAMAPLLAAAVVTD